MSRKSKFIKSNANFDLIKDLSLRDLEVDEIYQREEKERWTSKLTSKFEPHSAGVITVSRRKNGKLYIIDGHHRREAALKAGYTSLPAKVYYGLSIRDEAKLFLMLNNQNHVTEGQKLKSEIAAGIPDAIELVSMIRKAGLIPLFDGYGSRCQYGFRAFSKLREVIRNNTDRRTGICDERTVIRILTMLAKTWNGNPESITQRFLLCLDKIVREYGDRFTDEEWIARVSRAKPEDIRRTGYAMARAGRYNWAECFAQAMIDEYNRGLPRDKRIPDYI